MVFLIRYDGNNLEVSLPSSADIPRGTLDTILSESLRDPETPHSLSLIPATLAHFYQHSISRLDEIAKTCTQHVESIFQDIQSRTPDTKEVLSLKVHFRIIDTATQFYLQIPTQILTQDIFGKTVLLFKDSQREHLEKSVLGLSSKYAKYQNLYWERCSVPILDSLGWHEGFDPWLENVIHRISNQYRTTVVINSTEVAIPYPLEAFLIENNISKQRIRLFECISHLPQNTSDSPTKDQWAEDNIDSSLLCPISKSIMSNPVEVECGHVFDNTNILQWLRQQNTCPCCRQSLDPLKLSPVPKIAEKIEEWIDNNFVKIVVYYNAGFGNQLMICGEKSSLQWDEGLLLKCINEAQWEIEIPYQEGCQFKLYRSNQNPGEGSWKNRDWEQIYGNRSLQKQTMRITPVFS